MIKNGQLLDEVFKLYKSRRDYTESKAYDVREKLLNDSEYSNVYYAIKNLNMDIAKANFDGDLKTANTLEKQRIKLIEQKNQILKSLGVSENDLTPRYNCPICGDSGYLQKGGVCACFYKTLQEVANDILGIQQPILPTFDNYKCNTERDKKLKQKLIDYCEKFPPETLKNLIFTGSTGTGKTFSAGAIASKLIQNNKCVIYLSATKLNDIFRIYHIMDESNKRAIFDLLCESDLLVIDDLGTEPLYKNVSVVYFTSIISERLANARPFIITTNLSLEEIGTRYNDRLLSRLSDKSTAIINFSGSDKRRKKTD